MNVNSALKRADMRPGSLPALCHVRTQWGDSHLPMRKHTLSRHWIYQSLDLGLPNWEILWEINFCGLSYPACNSFYSHSNYDGQDYIGIKCRIKIWHTNSKWLLSSTALGNLSKQIIPRGSFSTSHTQTHFGCQTYRLLMQNFYAQPTRGCNKYVGMYLNFLSPLIPRDISLHIHRQ